MSEEAVMERGDKVIDTLRDFPLASDLVYLARTCADDARVMARVLKTTREELARLLGRTVYRVECNENGSVSIAAEDGRCLAVLRAGDTALLGSEVKHPVEVRRGSWWTPGGVPPPESPPG